MLALRLQKASLDDVKALLKDVKALDLAGNYKMLLTALTQCQTHKLDQVFTKETSDAFLQSKALLAAQSGDWTLLCSALLFCLLGLHVAVFFTRVYGPWWHPIGLVALKSKNIEKIKAFPKKLKEKDLQMDDLPESLRSEFERLISCTGPVDVE